VPPGFQVELFASNLRDPRTVRVAPNGDIFIAESEPGRIRVLRAADGAAKPSSNDVFASGLDQPFGIAFYPSGSDPQWIYVANTGSVVRYPYRSGDLKARGKAEVIVRDLPHAGGRSVQRGHITRDIVFSKDGRQMFVSVGSASNDGEGMLVGQKGEEALDLINPALCSTRSAISVLAVGAKINAARAGGREHPAAAARGLSIYGSRCPPISSHG